MASDDEMADLLDALKSSLESRKRTGAVQMNDKAADALTGEVDRLRAVIAEIGALERMATAEVQREAHKEATFGGLALRVLKFGKFRAEIRAIIERETSS